MSGDEERLIEKAEEAGDFITGEDGFVVWWPDNNGALGEYALQTILDYLKSRNAAWAAQIERDLG